MPARRRYRAALSLPADPSDEELARDWPLSAAIWAISYLTTAYRRPWHCSSPAGSGRRFRVGGPLRFWALLSARCGDGSSDVRSTASCSFSTAELVTARWTSSPILGVAIRLRFPGAGSAHAGTPPISDHQLERTVAPAYGSRSNPSDLVAAWVRAGYHLVYNTPITPFAMDWLRVRISHGR
jgi:hypothetical protein